MDYYVQILQSWLTKDIFLNPVVLYTNKQALIPSNRPKPPTAIS